MVPARHPNTSTGFLRFAALFFLLCLLVFRGAMWGSQLLAPLDIPPTLFTHYRYVDPEGARVPQNHYIIDQIYQDLPSQHFLYNSLRAGEVPWWTPYDWGGRPFLADSHVNGLDVIRLALYHTLPFELAYNWTLILRTILTGFGMFLLLRRFAFGFWIASLGAVLWAFSGPFAFYFAHPFVEGTFAWYPWIWLAWHALFSGRSQRLEWLALVLFLALALYGANLQTTAYLPLFLGALTLGYGVRRCAVTAGFALMLALMLAAPTLGPSIDAYIHSARPDEPGWSVRLLAMPFASLSCIFPWMLGTFKTLDLGRFIGTTGIGFTLFTGTLAPLLAIWGARKNKEPHFKTALLLVIGYFIMTATPLFPFLYTRSAPLAVLGILMLAALGLRRILNGELPSRRTGIVLLAVVLLGAIGIHAFAWLAFPKLKSRLMEQVMQADGSGPIGKAPELRAEQVDRLPSEITAQNPEIALTLVALIAAALLIARGRQPSKATLATVLLISSAPVFLFYLRYTPSHPIALWDKLREGGPDQHATAALVQKDGLRLIESAEYRTDRIFPQNFTMLFGIHTVHGYCSLQPPSVFLWPPEIPPPPLTRIADVRTPDEVLHPGLWSRFQWIEENGRAIQRTEETANSITLSIGPGPEGTLLRTDTRDSGWNAQLDGDPVELLPKDAAFAVMKIPERNSVATLTLTYRPYVLNAGIGAAAIGALLLLLTTAYKRKPAAEASS